MVEARSVVAKLNRNPEGGTHMAKGNNSKRKDVKKEKKTKKDKKDKKK